jgi:hypothetical protein
MYALIYTTNCDQPVFYVNYFSVLPGLRCKEIFRFSGMLRTLDWMKRTGCLETSVTNYVALRGADKSLARRGRKQATGTEDFDVHISYL